MRFMEWSYEDLMNCPRDLIEVIAEEAKREAEERERDKTRHQ